MTGRPSGRRVIIHPDTPVSDAADALGAHKHTVSRWIAAGLLTSDAQRPHPLRGIDLCGPASARERVPQPRWSDASLRVTAEAIAKALGGRKAGSGWMACCPAHEDRNPSLSIRAAKDGKALVRCHAGCDQKEVITALRARGLWEINRRATGPLARDCRHSVRNEPDLEVLKRTGAALEIWQASQPADGTRAEDYLRLRGINPPVRAALRFHPRLKHPSGSVWPGMVALVTLGDTGAPVAIHRTFLAFNGQGKAPLDPAKMMLGPCRGGVVRLGPPAGPLMVGEGIETCLAAMQATGNSAWAALSTSGLRSLELPSDLVDVIVLADGDEAGEAAALHCASRWKLQGRRVRIARPPHGMDFNDILMGRAPRIETVSP